MTSQSQHREFDRLLKAFSITGFLVILCFQACNESGTSFQSSHVTNGPTIVENQLHQAIDDADSNIAGSEPVSLEKGQEEVKCGYEITDREQLPSMAREICDTISPLDEVMASSPFPLEIIYCFIDLNEDGENEIIAWESSWAGTSGGMLWVLSQKRKGFHKIFESEMTWSPIILLPSTSHHWKDFAYLMTGGGVDPTFITVSHNGKSYKDGKKASSDQPNGEIIIGKNWSSSVFGPISNN